MLPYSLEELSPEDSKNLTDELQAVLAKYDAEMGVTSHINIMKRVHPSPLSREDLDNDESSTEG